MYKAVMEGVMHDIATKNGLNCKLERLVLSLTNSKDDITLEF